MELPRGLYQLLFFTHEILITNKTWGRVIEKDAYTESLEAFVIDKAHCVKNGKSQVMLPGIHSCYHGICIAIAGVIHLILC